MKTVDEAAAERNGDIKEILRLMVKHNWTRLTITEYGFVVGGDDPGATLIHGVRREDLE
jgi:hypothetical protein